ncbi:MAG TPA: response regulator [Polyangiaceae bacterium]|jgi:CheY-like chemotaxis protein|nr:response regulator [Polyangiaceae bacterium]
MDDRARLADAPIADEAARAEETRRATAVGLALTRAKHDLNNLFHVARGWSRLLKDPRSGFQQTQEGINAVLAAAEQTSDLVTGVLSLGSRASEVVALCSLAQELAELARGLRYLLPTPDRLRLELCTHTLTLCKFADVRRALLDSVLDVKDALGDDELVLRLCDAQSGPARPEVELTLQRISKTAGSDAVPERRLCLRFPAASSAPGAAEAGLGASTGSAQSNQATVTRPNSSAVLLVDDHRDVRRLATTMLERAGYQVLTASDAEEARLTSQSYDGTIHLLCCDSQIPGSPALQLIEELVRTRPELRVLLCSGEQPEGKLAKFPRLSKPFSYQELVRAVRGCLT